MQINGIISRVTNGRRSSVNQLYSSQLLYSLFFLCPPPPPPPSNNCSCSSVVWVNTRNFFFFKYKKSLQFFDEEQKRRLRKKGLLTSVTVQMEKPLISKKLHYNLGKQIKVWNVEWRIMTKQKVESLSENKTKCSTFFLGTEKKRGKKQKRGGGEVNIKTKTKFRSYLIMSNRPFSNIIMIINLTTPRSAITQHSQQNMTGNDHSAQFLLISFITPSPPKKRPKRGKLSE